MLLRVGPGPHRGQSLAQLPQTRRVRFVAPKVSRPMFPLTVAFIPHLLSFWRVKSALDRAHRMPVD